jgi:hypothetical protein
VNHWLSIDCGKNLSKGNWQKYRANSSRLITPIRNRVLVFGLALPNSYFRPIALPRLRQNWGHRWQPPQQIQQLTHEQMALIKAE